MAGPQTLKFLVVLSCLSLLCADETCICESCCNKKQIMYPSVEIMKSISTVSYYFLKIYTIKIWCSHSKENLVLYMKVKLLLNQFVHSLSNKGISLNTWNSQMVQH